MANEPSDESGKGSGNPQELPQHPLVERLKPDPSQPAKRVTVLTGLPGNSDRAGYQRLYLTTKLDYYAEFLASEILHSEAVAADQSPFPGHEATRVSVARDATIHYIWARSSEPVDEFDLDIRLGAPGAAPAALPATRPPGQTCVFNGCTDATCDTCPITRCGDTCPRTQCNTCHTCNTCPGQHTCAAGATCAGHGTCVPTQCFDQACLYTNNQQNTCGACALTNATCFTACGQATCANTQCQQAAACFTVPATCAQTCGG
jgi:hypothetical protein